MEQETKFQREIKRITAEILNKLPEAVQFCSEGRIEEKVPTYSEAMEPYQTLLDNPHAGKLTIGKKYTYKGVCDLFEEETKSGKSRSLQIESWEVYYHFEREGNWFIPTEEYAKVLNLPDCRGRRAAYSDILGNLLGVLLYKSFTSTRDMTSGLYYLTIPKTYLYIILGFFNREFMEYSYSPMKQELGKNLLWNQFAAEVFRKSDDLLNAGLKDLKRKTLCRYRNVDEIYIEEETGRRWIELSDGLGVHLDSVKAEVIYSLGCRNIREVYQKKLGELYHASVCEVFSRLLGIPCFGFRSSIKIMGVQWRIDHLIRKIFSGKQQVAQQLKNEIALGVCGKTIPQINKIMIEHLENRTLPDWEKLLRGIERDSNESADILTEVCLNTDYFSEDVLYQNLEPGDKEEEDEEQLYRDLIEQIYSGKGQDKYDAIRHLWIRKFISFNQASWKRTIMGDLGNRPTKILESSQTF